MDERRQRLERREYGKRIGRDELRVLPELHDDERRRALRGRDFGGDRSERHAGVHVVESIVARHAQHVLGELRSVETARVPPHESTFADSDTWGDTEQTSDQIRGEVRGGRPARTPKTDVAHDA